jgi:hypothetical protein
MIGRCPDGWSRIHNFHICWTRVRTKLTDVRTVVFELRFLPYVWARPDGNPRRPDCCSNLPIYELGKNLKLGRTLDVIQTDCWVVRTDCWVVQMDASSHRSFSMQWRVQTEIHVVQADNAWSVWHPNGMARRPNGWSYRQMSVRMRWHVIWMADREPILLTCNQCRISEILLNSGLPVKSIFTYKWFCPKQNKANHKLTNSPFGHSGTKITWPVWKYIPGPKIKITLSFCHKGTKGKTE